MNEKDIEKRLRSVTSGRQPVAPQSLRTFLRAMPDTEARHNRGPLGAVRGLFSVVPSLMPALPTARKVQMAAAVSFAVLLSFVGAGLLISLRQTPRQLASPSQRTSIPTQVITPRRTTPNTTIVSVSITDNPYWYGTTRSGNDNGALPIETAALSNGGYLGISSPPYGLNGLVRSDKGLLWNWSPLSEVDPDLGGLASITTDGTGRAVVVGWATDAGGIKSGRAYYSDDGNTWAAAADQKVFSGTVLRKVVHGATGFVALGWNDGSQADSIRPVVEWVSTDGISWTRISGVPIRGSSAFLMTTAAGYVLSGTPIKAGLVDQPPFWYSNDGATWERASVTDNTALRMGPLVSATVFAGGTVVALSALSDGMSNQFVLSTDAGRHWRQMAVEGFPDPSMVTNVGVVTGSMNSWLVATYSAERAQVYVSKDDGLTWKAAVGENSSPIGPMLVEVAARYGTDYRRVLVFGPPSEGSGPWLAAGEEIAWP